MSIIRKETSMIKTTTNNTKRNAFAKSNIIKRSKGTCNTKTVCRGLVLDNYKIIATGVCLDKQNNLNLNNIIAFKTQKEVA